VEKGGDMKRTILAVVTVAILTAIAVFFVVGCSQNVRARDFGGDMEIRLPKGQKLVNVTWKENDFWYLVRDMRPGETAERWEFVEKSSMGFNEGKVILIESGRGESVNQQGKGF
jgi:hypothetical protein